MIARALAVWCVLLAGAIANGAAREGLLIPRLGSGAAHVVSTLLLCAIVLLLAMVTIRWINPRSRVDALRVGVLWLALVLAFEFLAGHYLFGDSWEALLAAYDVSRGQTWVLVPITTLVAPALAQRIRK